MLDTADIIVGWEALAVQNGYIVSLDEVDSTNTEAVRRLVDLPPSGTVIAAKRQLNGVGKQDRHFESCTGGLYMSYIIDEADMLTPLGLVTSTAAVAVTECIKQLSGLDTRIKWPNDVVCGGKKLCGILTLKKDSFIIVGIGLNVAQESFSAELSDIATSLYILTGNRYSVQTALELLKTELDSLLLKKFCTAQLLKRLRQSSATIGTVVRVALPEGEIAGLAVDINSDGALIVDTDGTRHTVYSGELI